jgi:DNA-binding winged helix-turn-helix (wHTH) protein
MRRSGPAICREAVHYWYSLASHRHNNSRRGGAMNIRGADSPTRARAKQLRFDHYVLDLDRGCLLLDGSEIVLRPKTFAVLRYLVENSGRLVSKDELFAAVWPNPAITDDVLVQSVGELRRALGEDGTRLIRTVPRRGYRFESEVSFVASTDQSSDAALLSSASPTLRQPTGGGTHELSSSLTGNLAPLGRRLFAVLILALVLAAGAVGIAIQWKFSMYPEIGGEARNRGSPLGQSERRFSPRLLLGWTDAGHHQRPGSVLCIDRVVMECRSALQGQARKPGGDRPRSRRQLPGRRQRKADRGPYTGNRATRRRAARTGALVGPF